MSIKKILPGLILTFLTISCSSESVDEPLANSQKEESKEPDSLPETEQETENNIETRLLKSFSPTDPGFAFATQHFQYQESRLIEYQYDNLIELYSYNDSGNLISKSSNSITFEYFYDDQSRLEKVNRINSNDEIDRTTNFFYSPNKVNISMSQVNSNFQIDIVHILDDEKRIIRIENANTTEGYPLKEYTYDNKGNITRELLSGSTTLIDKDNTYQYNEIINPFFIAYQKLNKNNYHFKNLLGIDIVTTFGTTPNVIERNDYKYTSDESQYPIKLVTTNENGEFEWNFDYY